MKKYTMTDSFVTENGPESTTTRLTQHFRALGMKTASTDFGFRVNHGSVLLFRLFGAAIRIGARNLPIAPDIRISSGMQGTTIACTAFDQLGWYLNKKLWRGAMN